MDSEKENLLADMHNGDINGGSTYFQDGIRSIDFILAVKNSGDSGKVAKMRDLFYESLKDQKLELEDCTEVRRDLFVCLCYFILFIV